MKGLLVFLSQNQRTYRTISYHEKYNNLEIILVSPHTHIYKNITNIRIKQKVIPRQSIKTDNPESFDF